MTANGRIRPLTPAWALVLMAAGLAALAAHDPAGATFRGLNGMILYDDVSLGNNEIFAVNPAGGDPINLTNHPGPDFWAAWSPDGTKIAFTSERDAGNREIYVMNADGSGQTRLTNTPGLEFNPVWSPDGETILFRNGSELWTMSATGANPAPLITMAGASASPEYSPDGTKLAFANNGDGDFELFVANADGSNPVQITNNAVSDSDPSWSPDGTRIAFGRFQGGAFEVMLINPDGTGEEDITNHPAYDSQPAWSPDGSLIVFWSDRAAASGHLYLMEPDGSNVEQLAPADASPDWQPLPFVQGDLDCDRDVDVDDAGRGLAWLGGAAIGQPPGCPQIGSEVASVFGDVSCGGEVNGVDVLDILRYFADLPYEPEQLPCPPIGSPLLLGGVSPP